MKKIILTVFLSVLLIALNACETKEQKEYRELSELFFNPTEEHKACVIDAFNHLPKTKINANALIEATDYVFNEKCVSKEKRNVFYNLSACYKMAINIPSSFYNAEGNCMVPIIIFNTKSTIVEQEKFNRFKELILQQQVKGN